MADVAFRRPRKARHPVNDSLIEVVHASIGQKTDVTAKLLRSTNCRRELGVRGNVADWALVQYLTGERMDSIVSNINVRSGLAAGVLFVSGAVCPAESQQLRIQLNFDQEFDQIKPTPSLITQYVSVNASMNLKGNIQSKENSNFVGGRHHGKHESVHTEEKTTRLGSSSAEEWRVAGQDKLINIVDYSGVTRASEIPSGR